MRHVPLILALLMVVCIIGGALGARKACERSPAACGVYESSKGEQHGS